MTADSYDVIAADTAGVLPAAAALSERSSDSGRGRRPERGDER